MNLDRFSRSITGETFFDEMMPVGKCACCEEEIFVGDDVIEWDDEFFCEKDCLADYIISEHGAEEKVIENN